MQINVEPLYAGNTAKIDWTTETERNEYTLERKLDSETDFTPIYIGSDNSFIDTIPENVQLITYRVKWSGDSFNKTWNEIDALNKTWEELDAIGWQWTTISEYTTTEPLKVIANRPPTISGQDADLGTKYKGFDIHFNLIDPDPNDTVDIVVDLDGDIILDIPNAEQDSDFSIYVTNAQILAMPDSSEHTVVITAANEDSTANRVYTFTAVEDLVSDTIFYVMRDDKPIAKLHDARQWTDYMEVGTHHYAIRAVDKYDNFVDSNEISVTTAVDHSTLASTSAPDEFIVLKLRSGGRPQKKHTQSIDYSETRYEGRAYPVYEPTGQRSASQSISFTALSLRERQRLEDLLRRPPPYIYRDNYNTRIVGVIPNKSDDFKQRLSYDADKAIIDFDLSIDRCDYSEVISYD